MGLFGESGHLGGADKSSYLEIFGKFKGVIWTFILKEGSVAIINAGLNKIENLLGPLRMCRSDVLLKCYHAADL